MVAVGQGFGSPLLIGFVEGCTTLLAKALGLWALRLDALPNTPNFEFEDIDLYHVSQRFFLTTLNTLLK